MDKALFNDLATSLKEAKEIRDGRAKPSRRILIDAIDVKAIREKTTLSQR